MSDFIEKASSALNRGVIAESRLVTENTSIDPKGINLSKFTANQLSQLSGQSISRASAGKREIGTADVIYKYQVSVGGQLTSCFVGINRDGTLYADVV